MLPDVSEMTRVLTQRKSAASARGIEIKRWPDEDAEMLRVVAPMQPRVVLEIGVRDGGWMWMIRPFLPAAVDYIALDIVMGRRWPEIRAMLSADGVSCSDVVGASNDESTFARVRQLLNGRSVDLLHVDANHAESAALADFDRYAPLVRPGGAVWMHDAHPRHGPWRALGTICTTERRLRVDKIFQCWSSHWEDPGKYCGNAVLVMI